MIPPVAAHYGNQGIVGENAGALGGAYLSALLERAKKDGRGPSDVLDRLLINRNPGLSFNNSESLEKIIEDLTIGNISLTSILTKSHDEIISLKDELSRSVKQQGSLKEREQSLEKNNAALTEQLRLSAAKVAALQKSPDCLKRIRDLEAKNRELEEIRKSLTQKNVKIEEQKQNSEKRISALEKENQELKNRNRSLVQSANDKKERAPEKGALDELRRQFEALKKENEILFSQLNLAKLQEESARKAESRACDKARDDVTKSRTDMISMGQQLEELKELLRIQTSLSSESERKKGDSTKRTDAALANAEAEKRALAGKVSYLSTELERVSVVLKTREQECAEMTKKWELAWARIKQLTAVRFVNRPRPDVPLNMTAI